EEDSNMLWRTYALSAFHPAPEEILVIGLGSGSWTKVLAAHPQVRKVTVIEINPGYLDILRGYSLIDGVLDDPKIEIVIDDGRRWMRANAGRRFDAIVANATFNWRSFASGLLSTDFLELVRPHLKDGGVFYYNTTWHPRVQRTGASVFPHALRLGNFLAVSDSPLRVDPERLAGVLGRYRMDGRPAFTAEGIASMVEIARDVDAAARMGSRHVIESRDSILRRTAGEALITDDNMGTEWDWLRIDTVDGKPHP
ncbi:MAG: methyltransferase domain-containing protein, partial [Planctomycetota bacterium]|nr:methyltransferase domain-containing protein [Planctomycetota bacterium]